MAALSIGEHAPEIRSKAWLPEEGKIDEFRLSAYRGKWVVITFYPFP